MRIWTASQRLGEEIEEETQTAAHHILRATKSAKILLKATPKAPPKSKATEDTTSADGAPAPKQQEGTRKATVVPLLKRVGGATLVAVIAESKWQKHSVCGFMPTPGSKHG